MLFSKNLRLLPYVLKSLSITILILLFSTTTSALAQSEINIGGSVNYKVRLKVYPEKRIPIFNNWSNSYNLIVEENDVSVFSTNFTTNLEGEILDLTLDGQAINNLEQYDLYLKGKSHLSKIYPDLQFSGNTFTLDLTSYGNLIAGDTNSPPDDLIDSNDISTTANLLDTSTDRSDLNNDGIVNSLDLSVILINFGQIGEYN